MTKRPQLGGAFGFLSGFLKRIGLIVAKKVLKTIRVTLLNGQSGLALTDVNQAATVKATGYDQNGKAFNPFAVTAWHSSNIAVVTVSASAGVTASLVSHAEGTATITAVSGSVTSAGFVVTVALPVIVTPPVVNCAVSNWSAWSAWTPINDTTEQRSRTRTVTTQPSNGGTTCPALIETQTQPIVIEEPPPPSPGPVLTADDLTYLGSFKMPSDGVSDGYHPPYNMHASDGAITGRTVSGTTTLLVQGPAWRTGLQGHPGVPHVMEMSIPTPSIASPPRAALVRQWENVNHGKILGVDMSAVQLHGICIDPSNPDHLWIGYKQYYSNAPDPCSILAVLSDDGTCVSYGPWRHGGGAYGGASASSGAVHGAMTTIPASWRANVGGKRLASLGVNQSHLNGLPMGSNLHAWNPVAPDTAPSGVTNDAPTADGNYAIADTPILWHSPSHPQARLTSNYKICGWNVNSPEYDATQGAYVQDPDGTFLGGLDGSRTKDMSTAAVFVQTDTKQGVVFFGHLMDTIAGHLYENGSPQICHSWYGVNTIDKDGKRSGDAGYDGANSCPHGQNDPTWGATGPGAGTLVGQVWVYDPDDLVAIAAGSVDPWSVSPASEFRVASIRNCTIDARVTTVRVYGGAWYDALTKRIYLSEITRDQEGCCAFVPRIHVFQVA